MKTPYLDKLIKGLEDGQSKGINSYYLNCQLRELKDIKQQLTLTDVVKSSSLWVVEFSDNEIKLMTSKELQDYEDDCMKFDGFMGCSVLGRLAKSK